MNTNSKKTEETFKKLLEYETYSFTHGRNITSAGKFFKNVTIPSGHTPELQHLDYKLRMNPIIELPFITGPDYIYNHPTNARILNQQPFTLDGVTYQKKKYEYTVISDELKIKLKINEKLSEGLTEKNLFDRPIVFLVHFLIQPSTPTPHTGICIVYKGKIYTIGYGYTVFTEGIPLGYYKEHHEKHGTYYSPDLQIDDSQIESVILWFGLLTDEIIGRLQEDMNSVTHIRFVTIPKIMDDEKMSDGWKQMIDEQEDEEMIDEETKRENVVEPQMGLDVEVKQTNKPKEIVQNNSKYYITLINNRIYDLYAYEHDLGIDEKDKTEWNCHKWALYILFGSIDAIIGGVTDDMVIEFNSSITTGYDGISAVDSDDEQDRQYETDHFDPNLMSYGIRPSNLYMLYEAMHKFDRDSYNTALNRTDHDFKIRWKIRMDKQQEEEELARQGGMNMKRKRKRNLRKTKKLRKMNKCKSKKVIVKRRNTHNCCRSVKRNKRK